MTIQIEPHTLQRAEERGTNLQEIEDVVRNGIPSEAKKNRVAKYKIYPFKMIRNGRFYEQKKVEVFFIPEENKIITVTVYVFYGKWEELNASDV